MTTSRITAGELSKYRNGLVDFAITAAYRIRPSDHEFWLTRPFRRIATRYDKTAKSFLAFLNLAAAKIWLPSFVNRT